MDKAREQHNVLMDKDSEQLTAFGISCYTINGILMIYAKNTIRSMSPY